MKVLLVVMAMIASAGAQENSTTKESEREITWEAFIAEVSYMNGTIADLSGAMLKAAVLLARLH